MFCVWFKDETFGLRSSQGDPADLEPGILFVSGFDKRDPCPWKTMPLVLFVVYYYFDVEIKYQLRGKGIVSPVSLKQET